MPFLDAGGLMIEQIGAERWRLIASLDYEGRLQMFHVPIGFITDAATVPRIVSWLFPRHGIYTRAAVLHDWLITDGREAVSSRDADGIFRRVLRELHVPFLRRWLMWAGVRWGALGKPGRRAEWWKDAPLVLLISLVALPVLVLPVTFVGLALVIVHVLERLTGGGARSIGPNV